MSSINAPAGLRMFAVIAGVAMVATALAPLFWAAAHVTA